jgi:sterol desaturase/sphingolipid hydroxylase (fatty acid hydroxylase superfamily)
MWYEVAVLTGAIFANLLAAIITVLIGMALCRDRSGVSSYARSLLLASFGNGLVTYAGIRLWQEGLLVLGPGSWWALVEFIVLVLVLDALMFVGHWLMHRSWIFPLVHRYHHAVVEPVPITLFHLSVVESVGFGGLFLSVLLLRSWDIAAVIAYIVFNLVLGVIAHLGATARWQNFITRMHLTHHRDPDRNFGFYTVIWDRLFRTYG